MNQVKETVEKQDGKYNLIREVISAEGKIISRVIEPIHVTLRWQDIFEMLFGAVFVALPFGFTNEVLRVGADMTLWRATFIFGITLVVLGGFIHQNLYRQLQDGLHPHLMIRIFFTYLMAFSAAVLVLTIIDQIHWLQEPLIALKRSFVLTLPASFGAVTVDTFSKR